jgi:hypothetical protein
VNAKGALTLNFLRSFLIPTSILILNCLPVGARPISRVKVPLTVCLTNEAEVAPKTVLEVESRVTAMFKESAIELRWINFSSLSARSTEPVTCGRLSYPGRLMVHWIPKAKTAPPAVLGEAFLDEQDAGVIADLFLDHVQAVESEIKVGLPTLLAYATAHEVGHLLLGANSHSTRGIMLGHFHGQNLPAIRNGSLTFERDEEERMHSRLMGDPLPSLLARGR